MRELVDLGRRNPACTAPRHGTASAYTNGGCRCPHARERHRIYRKRRNAGRQAPAFVDSEGTARRLQALMYMGWSSGEIAERLDRSVTYICRLATGGGRPVTAATADRVRRLAADIGHLRGPSQRARRLAIAKGYVSLAAWDDIDDPFAVPDLGVPGSPVPDPVAIEKVIGEELRFTAVPVIDRAAVVAVLRARGMTTHGIAQKFKTSAPVIQRAERLLVSAAVRDVAGTQV